MQIVSRLCTSADGYVTTPDGWPAQLADPAFEPGQSHGIPEFLQGKEAALMGRTTFEPALGAGRWPWPNLEVFVLASRRPDETPDHVQLSLVSERALPGGSVEIVYACR
jgi:dihydrofolate reductase